MSSSNGGPSNGAGNELAARRAQLELQAQRLRQQAAAINGELAECEAAIRTCKQAESDGAAEPEPKRACRPSADAHMPKKWRHVSEVQAEFAEKRAAERALQEQSNKSRIANETHMQRMQAGRQEAPKRNAALAGLRLGDVGGGRGAEGRVRQRGERVPGPLRARAGREVGARRLRGGHRAHPSRGDGRADAQTRSHDHFHGGRDSARRHNHERV